MEKENIDPQENTLQAGGTPKRRRFLSKGKIIAFSIAAVIILLPVWDIFIDPPAFWHFRQEDKQAIVQYQRQHYPGAKTVDRYFPFLGNPALIGAPVDSSMTFELDGVNFSISAWDGEISRDTYYEKKADKYIRENFIDGFMNDRGLTPDIRIAFISPPDHYGSLGKDELGDVTAFKGSINVQITQDHIDGVLTPRDVGWFYDFYQYWMENCDLTNCSVDMYYRCNNDYATNQPSYNIEFKRGEKTFSDENDFYNHFTT